MVFEKVFGGYFDEKKQVSRRSSSKLLFLHTYNLNPLTPG